MALKLWRSILWLIASLFLWVYAHDFVAQNINMRIQQQHEKQIVGDLDFIWDVNDSNDVVTYFESEQENGGFIGKQVSFSLRMRDWPLNPALYHQLQLNFSSDSSEPVVLALETSDPKNTLFYTAKIELIAGAHSIDLNTLDWSTKSGKVLSWQNIPQASTWVVRIFSHQETKWQFSELAIVQGLVPMGLSSESRWKIGQCNNLQASGQWRVDCVFNNRMVQIDDVTNKQDSKLTVLFVSWLSWPAWWWAAISSVLIMLAFIGHRRLQAGIVAVGSVAAFLMYMPMSVNGVLYLLIPALLAFGFLFRKRDWRLSQTGLLQAWFLVFCVAMILWFLSDWNLAFVVDWPAYFAWAVFQQTFLVRLYEFFKQKDEANKQVSLILAAWCFSLIHLPNQYLMLVTLVGSLFWLFVWSKKQNMWLMVISHSLLALLLYQWAGEAWLHSARVGLNFL